MCLQPFIWLPWDARSRPYVCLYCVKKLFNYKKALEQERKCDMLSVAPHVQVVSRSKATLLGAPIGDIISIDTCILDKITKLEIMGERLSLLSSYDILLLLRHSLCIPKILYVLRTAPCFISDKLHTFDNY